MRLINRSSTGVLWRAFNHNDALTSRAHALFLGRVPRQSTWVNANEVKTQNWPIATLQLEITDQPRQGMFLAPPVYNVHVYGSTSRTFSNASDVVFTGSGLVELTEEVQGVMALAGYTPGNTTGANPPSPDVDRALQSLLALTMALVDGLIAGFAAPSMTLGGAKASVGLATAILGSLRDDVAPPPLSLDAVQRALEAVVSEAFVKQNRAHIIAAQEWFDGWIRKSRSLAAGQTGAADLSPADRSRFITELDAYLLGTTPFKGALDELRFNRDWRVLCVPEYILGMTLLLHLRRIKLLLKQESTALQVGDVEDLLDLIGKFRASLGETETDFRTKRVEFFRRYPIVPESSANSLDDRNVVFVGMDPVEARRVAAGLTAKYLKGDRTLIDHTVQKLDDAAARLKALNISGVSAPA